ncbi:hypothetical protein [Actinotalea sp. JY-7885]|nr:hypothetical protein [Actinotalea sp. JY-7885]
MHVPALVPDEPDDARAAVPVRRVQAEPAGAERTFTSTRAVAESDWALYHRATDDAVPLPAPGAPGWAETVIGPDGTVTFVPRGVA